MIDTLIRNNPVDISTMNPTTNPIQSYPKIDVDDSDSGMESIDTSLVNVDCHVACRLPSTYGGTHQLHLYTNNVDKEEHMAIVFGPFYSKSLNTFRNDDDENKRRMRGAQSHTSTTPTFAEPPLVRIHSCCFTGETLGSSRCDCAEQLQVAMKKMSVENGIIVYLQQEGRGIGLLDKLYAYNLIDMGHDTLSANIALGHPPDARTYHVAAAILKDFGIEKVRLLTNNPNKIQQLQVDGIDIVERVSMVPESWNSKTHALEDRDEYLVTKVQRMGHVLDIPGKVLSSVNKI